MGHDPLTAEVVGQMVRNRMLIAIERRFGNYRAPHRVELLPLHCCGNDRLRPRPRPHADPQSPEFVLKIFKKDYVRCKLDRKRRWSSTSSTLGLNATTTRLRIDISRCFRPVSTSKSTYNSLRVRSSGGNPNTEDSGELEEIENDA